MNTDGKSQTSMYRLPYVSKTPVDSRELQEIAVKVYSGDMGNTLLEPIDVPR